MIHELRIRGLGVIDEAVIPFSSGLTVLTGETGAGKTMVLTGLGLIRGEKADSGLVRSGADSADADGEWRLTADEADAIASRLEEAGTGLERDGDEWSLILGRSVSAAGRSRAIAGGRSVPAATLADVTDALLAVHGQADQLHLRDARHQRDLLDLFGGRTLADRRTAFTDAFVAWRDAARELADLVEHRQEREREAALLRHGIEEIEAVAPVAGEDVALKAQAQMLAHATDLVAEVGSAHAALAGGEDGSALSATDLVSQARRSVERAAALDASLQPLLEQIDGVAQSLAVAASELASYARDTEADPQAQAQVEERRERISALKRRYGPELDDVLAWWEQAQRTVASADTTDERIEQLQSSVAALRAQVVDRAAALTKERTTAAKRFGTAVTAELHDLAMPDARITVDVQSADEPEAFTESGADAVAMLLVPHAGSEPRPLGKGASGGELSRVMLAIEVVLAGVNPVASFVFDEVDAGIGGKVAVEVGRRLARLARSAQVIVVTHLPQVAAFADRHVVVSKDRGGQVTASSVTVVEGDERVRELVRMLSGLEGSESGAQHAAELLAVAEAERR